MPIQFLLLLLFSIIQLMETIDSLRMDKTAFTVTTLSEEEEENAYWRSVPAEERLRAIETMRRIIYGYDPATARLQGVLTTAELSRD